MLFITFRTKHNQSDTAYLSHTPQHQSHQHCITARSCQKRISCPGALRSTHRPRGNLPLPLLRFSPRSSQATTLTRSPEKGTTSRSKRDEREGSHPSPLLFPGHVFQPRKLLEAQISLVVNSGWSQDKQWRRIDLFPAAELKSLTG